jgi:small subunit ribosomal protein S4
VFPFLSVQRVCLPVRLGDGDMPQNHVASIKASQPSIIFFGRFACFERRTCIDRMAVKGDSIMARYTGPKVRLSRRVGVPIADIPKHTGKELSLPGMHGYRGRRNTEYGVRLAEKQKLRYHYGMLERQFRLTMGRAKRSKGNTGNAMMQLLELRLDNVLRRLGVGRTIWATRQIVSHGHVLVDGRKTDIASYEVKPGQTLTFKEKFHKVLRDNMEQNAGHQVPNWLEWNPAQLTAKINALPNPEDVPFEVNMNLIIEFYR